MLKRFLCMVSLVMMFCLLSFPQATSATKLSESEIQTFLDDALHAQLSLNAEKRELNEVKEILSPYFTEDYQSMFIHERLFKDVYGWYLPGSDDFFAFIPDFSFNEDTKIHQSAGKIKITEFVEANNTGPWTWDAHTESLEMMETNDGWKISNINEILEDTNPITMVYDGNQINLEQHPVIENQRTLVPLRGFFEYIGAEVSWYGQQQKITIEKESTFISLFVNSNDVNVNQETISIDTPPKIINGHTMVPVRFISETLGSEVSWDQETRSIEIH